MDEHFQRVVCCALALLVLLLFCLILTSRCKASDDKSNLEIAGLYVMDGGRKTTHGNLAISYGRSMNNWFGVRMEGEVGKTWYTGRYGYQAGLLGVLRFDPQIVDRFRVYLDIGTGVGYIEGDGDVIFSGMCGLVHGGAGAIFDLKWNNIDFLVGYQFYHISSLKPRDPGMNGHGVRMGVRW